MSLKTILKELEKMTPEERKALQGFFGAPAEAKAEKKEEPLREKHGPEQAKASTIYFFRQLHVFRTDEEQAQDGGNSIKKKVTQLPPRVIIADEKMAWRLFWKSRGKFEYLGRSNGQVWRSERAAGKRVSEAQAAEYNAMLKAPDMTPPMNREKTFFAGTKLQSASRGQEIPWSEGIKQSKQF